MHPFVPGKELQEPGHATWVLPAPPLNRRSFRLLEQVAEPPGERQRWAEVSESPSGSVKKAQVLICGSLPQLCQEPDAVTSYLAACADYFPCLQMTMRMEETEVNL